MTQKTTEREKQLTNKTQVNSTKSRRKFGHYQTYTQKFNDPWQ